MMKARLPHLLVLLGVSLRVMALANPEPDIPVRCQFEKDGAVVIAVEVDPRCFTEDPMNERFMMKADQDRDPAGDLDALKQQTAEAIARWIEFQFEPAAALRPEFALAFTGQNLAALVKADDPVVITATWRFQRPAGMTALRVRATKEARCAVVVRHFMGGAEQKRFCTLFPGEMSFPLEMEKPR